MAATFPPCRAVEALLVRSGLPICTALPRVNSRVIDSASRAKATHLLHADWKPAAFADIIFCFSMTVYRYEKQLQMYNSLDIRRPLPTGRPRRIHTVARESLFEYQRQHPWTYQDELVTFLEEEWDIRVNRATISRLKKHRVIRKRGQKGGAHPKSTTTYRVESLDA